MPDISEITKNKNAQIPSESYDIKNIFKKLEEKKYEDINTELNTFHQILVEVCSIKSFFKEKLKLIQQQL